ncbi:MAG: hypothetical protein AAFV93_19080, partial [Chloroflexota bacterium]
MKRVSALLATSLLFALSILFTVEAQSSCTTVVGAVVPCPTQPPAQPTAINIPDADGDGTSDATDQCPSQGGPAWNNGCPLPADADGDGTADENDSCPNQGGPDWNNGCPSGDSAPASTEVLPALPQFPNDPNGVDEDGNPLPCLIATSGYNSVNLREQASTSSPVESILNPYEPAFGSQYHFVIIRGINVEEWYRTTHGFAAGWVTRRSPQCDDLMTTWYFNYNAEMVAPVVGGLNVGSINNTSILEQNSVTLICPGYTVVFTPNDALTDCSGLPVSPAPNGERFLCDSRWVEAYNDCDFGSLPSVLISESAQLMALTIAPPLVPTEATSPSDDKTITLLFGNTNAMDALIFNPETEHPPDPGAEGIFVVLLVGNVPDINLVGFNPQPEPPARENSFGLLVGLNVPDVDIVGFNPQPEPPAIVTDFGEFALNPTAI